MRTCISVCCRRRGFSIRAMSRGLWMSIVLAHMITVKNFGRFWYSKCGISDLAYRHVQYTFNSATADGDCADSGFGGTLLPAFCGAKWLDSSDRVRRL